MTSATAQPDALAPEQRVGLQIRLLREQRSLSARELARRAGISQAFLSQLERGMSGPSIATTYRLADALGVLPGVLLPAPASELVKIVRATEGRMLSIANRADAVRGRALSLGSDSALEVVDYVIEPGEYISEWFQARGTLSLYVIEGSLEVEIESAGTYQLKPQDFLMHPASLRHRWTLLGDERAHVLLTIAHTSDP